MVWMLTLGWLRSNEAVADDNLEYRVDKDWNIALCTATQYWNKTNQACSKNIELDDWLQVLRDTLRSINLWDEAKLFAEMPKDKKNIFANILTKLLRDNGKMYDRISKKKQTVTKVDTVEDIKYLMRDLVRFLHNLEFKEFDAVPSYDRLVDRFQRYIVWWLIVGEEIMYTIYGLKSFAEYVDFLRAEVFWKPGEPSEKYKKEYERKKLELARLEWIIKSNEEKIIEISARIETLKLVKQMLEAMSSVK